MPHTECMCPAPSLSGTTGAIAFQIRSRVYIIGSKYIPADAGRSASNIEPFSVSTLSGRKVPSLATDVGPVSAVKMICAPTTVH